MQGWVEYQGLTITLELLTKLSLQAAKRLMGCPLARLIGSGGKVKISDTWTVHGL